MGRDAAPAAVDQPELTQGSWVSDGGVVVEAAFADALDVRVGDPITLDGRSFQVVGVAVTAAMPPYPESSCLVSRGCASGATPEELSELPPGLLRNPGLVWLTEADVRSLAPDADSLSYVMNLKLADPDGARRSSTPTSRTSPDAPRLESWQDIREEATERARDAQILLMIGAWLLGLLAVASVAVLVGGRMADQTRRVGLLKAVGGTPSLVAAVLLAEYVLVALVAAAAGLAVGWLTAPLLTDPGAGLLGSAGTPSLTMSTVGPVTAVALGVAVVATARSGRARRPHQHRPRAGRRGPPTPAHRLADRDLGAAARPAAPRPAGRRPAAAPGRAGRGQHRDHGQRDRRRAGAQRLPHHRTTRRRLDDAQAEQLSQVLLVVTVMLLALAAVNAIFITWATALDARHSSALARALGATPGEVSAGLSAAQVLPALAGAVLGVFPGGFALFARHQRDHRRRQRQRHAPAALAAARRGGGRPCSWWRRSPPFPPASAPAGP